MKGTHPRPARPILVIVAVSVVIVATPWWGVARAAIPFALAAAALVRDDRTRLGVRVAAGIGAIALIAAGQMLAVAAALAVLSWALGREAARRWTSARWANPIAAISSAEIDPAEIDPAEIDPAEIATRVDRALDAALRAPASDHASIDRAVALLARARPPDDPDLRRGFLIDVYNVLARHAGRDRRSTAFYDVAEIFRTRYVVFGAEVTPDLIEHALLRDDAPHPVTRRRLSKHGDPRLRWSVPLDPRIHFALNCGAVACPPIRIYRDRDPAAVDRKLAAAAVAFVEATTSIRDRTIETSAILRWYARDFGGPVGIRRFLARTLAPVHGCAVDAFDDHVLVTRPYDWCNPELVDRAA